jgi:hypothetical protein
MSDSTLLLLTSLALFVLAGIKYLSQAMNQSIDKTSEDIARSHVPPGFDMQTLLQDGRGRGALAISTTRGEIFINLPGSYDFRFHASKILDARVDTEIRTTYETRGGSTGVGFDGFMVSSGRYSTSSHSQVIGSYITLALDDFQLLCVSLPFKSVADAQQWFGLLRTLVQVVSQEWWKF